MRAAVLHSLYSGQNCSTKQDGSSWVHPPTNKTKHSSFQSKHTFCVCFAGEHNDYFNGDVIKGKYMIDTADTILIFMKKKILNFLFLASFFNHISDFVFLYTQQKQQGKFRHGSNSIELFWLVYMVILGRKRCGSGKVKNRQSELKIIRLFGREVSREGSTGGTNTILPNVFPNFVISWWW